MSNSRTRSLSYTPRMTQMEAFDQLDLRVREFLRETLTEWDCPAILRFQKKNTVWQTIEWLKEAEAKEARRPWWRGMPNPTLSLGLAPIKPNYCSA